MCRSSPPRPRKMALSPDAGCPIRRWRAPSQPQHFPIPPIQSIRCGETCRVAHLLGLPKMAAIVSGDDQQTGAHWEAKEFEKRIAKVSPVQIDGCSFANDDAQAVMGAKKCLQSLILWGRGCGQNVLW